MREIVLDTETTGLSPEEGDRIIEIGAVELANGFPTGNTFHHFINPQGRPVHPEALAVHGITDDFLKDKPSFPEIAQSMLAFFSDANLIAHNAAFDIGFLNAELARLNVDFLPAEKVVDTLALARRKHPMGPNSLDALCSRYGIDNSRRTKHGALLDAELLAEVYVEMSGGRQAALALDGSPLPGDVPSVAPSHVAATIRPESLAARITAAEIEIHIRFVTGMAERPVWTDYTAFRQRIAQIS